MRTSFPAHRRHSFPQLTTTRQARAPHRVRYRPFLELLEDRMVLASSVGAAPPPVITFSALAAYNGTGQDASAVINAFLAGVPAHAVVELPPGVYTVKHSIVLPKPLTLTTQGLENAPKCDYADPSGAAEILADPGFEGNTGLLYSDQDGTCIDHLVFDGNKSLRTGPNVQQCLAGDNTYGTNLFLLGSFAFTNSVSRNALSGTALSVLGKSHDITIVNNTFAFNGVHNGLFADGLTIADTVNSQVLDNEFISGGTDVALILGGGRDTKVQGNVFRYGPSFSGGAFAALMLHAWPRTSGDFTGADVSGNVIDGGPNRRVGYGLLIGSESWYPSNPYGADVHDNTITNVQMGLSVDRGTDIRLANNTVTSSGGLTYTSSGQVRLTSAYNISPDSVVDLSGDSDPGKYTHITLVGAIPNWINSADATVQDGNLVLGGSIIGQQFLAIFISPPASVLPGLEYATSETSLLPTGAELGPVTGPVQNPSNAVQILTPSSTQPASLPGDDQPLTFGVEALPGEDELLTSLFGSKEAAGQPGL